MELSEIVKTDEPESEIFAKYKILDDEKDNGK